MPKKKRRKCIAVIKLITNEEIRVMEDEEYEFENFFDVVNRVRYQLPIKITDERYINSIHIVEVMKP